MLGLAEWSRGFVGTGFPWNMPGSLFAVDVAALQAASLFGAYGLTVLALLFAMVPAFWAVGGRTICGDLAAGSVWPGRRWHLAP